MKSIELTSNKINDKGFTLIEVLIAMVIFAIGILAVAQMQIRALHANKDAFSQTEATMWATNQAETLIGLPYDDAQLAPKTYPATPDLFRGPNNKYGLSWGILDNGSSRTITITVSWDEKGDAKEHTFEYIKGQPGS